MDIVERKIIDALKKRGNTKDKMAELAIRYQYKIDYCDADEVENKIAEKYVMSNIFSIALVKGSELLLLFFILTSLSSLILGIEVMKIALQSSVFFILSSALLLLLAIAISALSEKYALLFYLNNARHGNYSVCDCVSAAAAHYDDDGIDTAYIIINRYNYPKQI